MADGYISERLNIYYSLIKKRLDVANGRFWTLEPRQMRFKHGETIAELKIPYLMGADDEAAIENAIKGLVALLVKRFEPARVEGPKNSQQPLAVTVQPLKEKTFRTDIFISDSIEKRLAEEILSCTPYLDSAILFNWLGSEGHGRKFIKWANDLFEKTLKEEARHGGAEKTSYLALLAAINTIRKKKEIIKGCRIKGLSYEKIDLAVGMALFAAFKCALSELFSRLQNSQASCYNPATEMLLLSAVAPKSFLTIPSNLLSTTLNPYFLNGETCEALARLASEFDEDDASSEFINTLSQSVKNSPEALEALKTQSAIRSFRQEALRYMMEIDYQGTEAQGLLYDMYNDDRLIKNLLNDPKMPAALSKSLEDVRKISLKDPGRLEIISSFQSFLSNFKKASMLGGFLKTIRKEADEDLLPIIKSYCACRFDDYVEKYAALMRGYLADRRDEFNQNMIKEEYNRGRLYRFSADERPLLKTLTIEEEGQLFIDMKDFTRKTLKVKEIAMAEFMREHFYTPILNAASKYCVGTGFVTDERGIMLTNLPGDAAIFSGGVAYLTALAKDIQAIIRRYREQLLQRMPPRKEEEILDEVHKRFEARKQELKQKRAELNALLDKNEPGIESRLIALGEEEHRLENTYRDEIETAIKGELEAGLYISYGSKAEITVIAPKEDFSGPVKVSIGEKINEAARGTFRNPLVRSRLEVLLENEKQKRKKKAAYPFDIYIDRIYSIKMPPELDNAFEKLLAARKPANAQAMAQILGNEFHNDLKRIISGDPFSSLRLITSTTDIYNKGQAMSINALEAYMRETKGAKWYFKKTIGANELAEPIREEFFFPASPLEFWFGVEVVKGVERIEAFYKSGEVIFKGFEANTPMVIYEILDTEGAFFKLLIKHHFHGWHEESKKSPAADGL